MSYQVDLEKLSLLDLLKIPLRILVPVFIGLLCIGFYAGQLVCKLDLSNSYKADLPEINNTSSTALTLGPNQIDPQLIELRNVNKVRLIDEVENELNTAQISSGKYGYVSGVSIKYFSLDKSPMELGVKSDGHKWELHCVENIKFFLAIYVPKTDMLRINQSKNVEITAYNTIQENTELYSLDVNNIKEFKNRMISPHGVLSSIANITIEH
jgi:hypothetical protein